MSLKETPVQPSLHVSCIGFNLLVLKVAGLGSSGLHSRASDIHIPGAKRILSGPKV